jgi:PEP-CTERM motif
MPRPFPMSSLALASALLIATSAAQAVVTVYTTQASYLAAVSAPGVDTFNSLNPVALNYFLSSPATRSAGPYSYTATASGAFYTLPHTATDVWLSALTAGAAINLNSFSSGVRGVGGFFFAVDGNDNVVTRNLNITTVDGSGSTVTTLSSASDTKFLGIVSNSAISSVSISLAGAAAGNYVAMNDITLGAAAVPEPSIGLMLLAGIAGLVALRRRRR